MSKIKNKGILCLVLMAIVTIICSLAYFSDRDSINTNGKAGTLNIDLTSNINLLDEDGQNILNPGDVRDTSFIVTNKGNKSTDLRTIIKLTSTVPMTDADQAEYELYEKSNTTTITGVGTLPLVFDNDFGYKGETGEQAKISYATDYVAGTVATDQVVGTVTETQPLSVRNMSADKKSITYNVPDVALNGNMTLAEFEREDGVNTDTHLYDYVLIVKSQSKNAFQDSIVTIDVSVLAKQHRNSGAGWTLVENDTETNNPDNNDQTPGTYSINTAAASSFLTLTTTNENGEEISEAKEGDTINVSYAMNKSANYLNEDDYKFKSGETQVAAYDIYDKDTNQLLDTVNIDSNGNVKSLASAFVINAVADENNGRIHFTMPKSNVVITEKIIVNDKVVEENKAANKYDITLDTGHEGFSRGSTLVSTNQPFDAYGERQLKQNITSFNYGKDYKYTCYYSDGTSYQTSDSGLKGKIVAGTEVTVEMINNTSSDFRNYGMSYFLVDYDTGEFIQRINTGNSTRATFTMPERNVKVMTAYNNTVVEENGITYVAMNIFWSDRDLTEVGSVTITSDKQMKDYGTSHTFNVNEEIPKYIFIQPNSNINIQFNKELKTFDEWMLFNDKNYNHDEFFNPVNKYLTNEEFTNDFIVKYKQAYLEEKEFYTKFSPDEVEEEMNRFKESYLEENTHSDIKNDKINMTVKGLIETKFENFTASLDKYYTESSVASFSDKVNIDAINGYHFADLFNVNPTINTADNLKVAFNTPGMPFEFSIGKYTEYSSEYNYMNMVPESSMNTIKEFIQNFNG